MRKVFVRSSIRSLKFPLFLSITCLAILSNAETPSCEEILNSSKLGYIQDVLTSDQMISRAMLVDSLTDLMSQKLQPEINYHRARRHYFNSDGLRFFQASIDELSKEELFFLKNLLTSEQNGVEELIDFLNLLAVENPNWVSSRDVFQIVTRETPFDGIVYGAAIGGALLNAPIAGAAIGHALNSDTRSQRKVIGSERITFVSLSYPDVPPLKLLKNYLLSKQIQGDTSQLILSERKINGKHLLKLISDLKSAGFPLSDKSVLTKVSAVSDRNQLFGILLDSLDTPKIDRLILSSLNKSSVPDMLGKDEVLNKTLDNRWSYIYLAFSLEKAGYLIPYYQFGNLEAYHSLDSAIGKLAQAQNSNDVLTVLQNWIDQELISHHAYSSLKAFAKLENQPYVTNVPKVLEKDVKNLLKMIGTLLELDYHGARNYLIATLRMRRGGPTF